MARCKVCGIEATTFGGGSGFTYADDLCGPYCHGLFDGRKESADEIDRLRADYAKLHGVVTTYVDAPGQCRGEAFRDLAGALAYLAKADEIYGWPACYERERKEVARLRAIVSRLPTTVDGVPVVPGDTVYCWIGTRVEAVLIRSARSDRYAYCYSTREAAEAAEAAGGTDDDF